MFLWVNLVVRNLLSTLVDNPSLSDLGRKLAEIPSDIVGLYNAIWQSTPTERQCRPSKILQICFDAVQPCRAEIMWLATEDNANPEAATNAGIHDVMKRVLDGHTRGICELVQGRVQFLHRSAADWIQDDSMRADLRSKVPLDFEPNLNLLEVCLQHHKVIKAFGHLTESGLFYMVLILLRGITKLYRTATRDRISQLRVRIIQATDNIHLLGDDFAAVQEKGCRSQRWTDRTKDSIPEGLLPRHWLTLQFQRRPSAGMPFVRLAAGLGFVDYVNEKMMRDPSLLVPQKGEISILENTICADEIDSKWITPWNGEGSHCYRAGRLEIIQFILETSPYRYKTAQGQPMCEALSSPDRFDLFPWEEKWYREVLEILREHGYESSTFWRRKLHQGKATGSDKTKASRLLRGFKNEVGVHFERFRRSRHERDSD